MLPVLGIPMMEHVVRQLASNGLTEIFVTTHYRAERIREYFGDGSAWGVCIRYAHEESLMNTAGSLKLLQPLIRDDFLVVGGNDLLPRLDVADFIRFHRARKGIGTIAFKYLTDEALLPLFGQGVLDHTERLIAFEEKPVRQVSNLIHTTYQIYSPDALERIPNGVPCSIPEYLIHRILASGEKIFGYRTDSPFICISTQEQYEHASEQLSVASGFKSEGV
jgi:NDP-sugar pyrophosphorylase family protein